MTLRLEDLVVTSFTVPGGQVGLKTDPATDPDEPTPATHCYACPEETQACS